VVAQCGQAAAGGGGRLGRRLGGRRLWHACWQEGRTRSPHGCVCNAPRVPKVGTGPLTATHAARSGKAKRGRGSDDDDEGDDDDDEEEEDDDVFVYKYGPDGIIDEQDRAELQAKTQLERERILAARVEERDDAYERCVPQSLSPWAVESVSWWLH
jgi:hypothetical protein